MKWTIEWICVCKKFDAVSFTGAASHASPAAAGRKPNLPDRLCRVARESRLSAALAGRLLGRARRGQRVGRRPWTRAFTRAVSPAATGYIRCACSLNLHLPARAGVRVPVLGTMLTLLTCNQARPSIGMAGAALSTERRRPFVPIVLQGSDQRQMASRSCFPPFLGHLPTTLPTQRSPLAGAFSPARPESSRFCSILERRVDPMLAAHFGVFSSRRGVSWGVHKGVRRGAQHPSHPPHAQPTSRSHHAQARRSEPTRARRRGSQPGRLEPSASRRLVRRLHGARRRGPHHTTAPAVGCWGLV